MKKAGGPPNLDFPLLGEHDLATTTARQAHFIVDIFESTKYDEGHPQIQEHINNLMGLVRMGVGQGEDEDVEWLESLSAATHNALKKGVSPGVLDAIKLAGLDPDYRDPHHLFDTPLITAVRFKRIDAINTILSWGANIERHGRGRTALVKAAELMLDGDDEASMAIMKLLLAAGADIDGIGHLEDGARAHPGHMPAPLMRAVNGRSPKLVRALLELGASPHVVDQEGGSLFHSLLLGGVGMTEECGQGIIAALVEAGGDINQPDSKGASALNSAINKQRITTSFFLMDAGADMSLRDNQCAGQMPNHPDNPNYRPGSTLLHHMVISMALEPFDIEEISNRVEAKHPDCWTWVNDLGETPVDLIDRARRYQKTLPLAIDADIRERTLKSIAYVQGLTLEADTLVASRVWKPGTRL